MTELSFRVAEATDVPALDLLVQSAFRGEASRVGWTTEVDLLDGRRTDAEALAEVVAASSSSLLLAERAGAVVGCCRLDMHGGEPAHLGMLSVRPEFQADGIGRALVTEAERRAVALGALVMQMTVIGQRAELIAWYERLGYRRTGETRPFPYNDLRFGVPRRDDLEFVVLEKRLTVA